MIFILVYVLSFVSPVHDIMGKLNLLNTSGGSIIQTVASRWKQIGYQLGLDAVAIEAIEADRMYDRESCCRAMFQYWLEGNGIQPVSWDTLIRILRDCHFNALATEVASTINPYANFHSDM